MGPFFGSFLLLCIMTRPCRGVVETDVARSFILHPEPLTWDQASSKCASLNATLATIDHMDTIPSMEFHGDWMAWIGLKAVPSVNLTWQDDGAVLWTNWQHPLDLNRTDISCVSVTSAFPYSWTTRPCNDLLPSLCQIRKGICNFTVTPWASVIAYNNLIKIDMSKDACLELCRTTQDFDCRSVEIHRSFDSCQLSAESRWSKPAAFITGDPYWDFYQWNCVNETYIGEYTTMRGNSISTTESVTTPSLTSEMTQESHLTSEFVVTSPQTTKDGRGQLVCAVIMPADSNTSGAIRQDVQELKDLGQVFKQQQKTRKKVSVPDPRPSATYVGSLALGLSLAVLGVIVLIDLISLPRHIREMQERGSCCCMCRKSRRKRKSHRTSRMTFTEFSERWLHSDAVFIVRSKVPDNFRPQVPIHDEYVEQLYHQSEVTLAADSVSRGDNANSAEHNDTLANEAAFRTVEFSTAGGKRGSL